MNPHPVPGKFYKCWSNGHYLGVFRYKENGEFVKETEGEEGPVETCNPDRWEDLVDSREELPPVW